MNTSRYQALANRLAALPIDKQQLFRQKLAEQGIDSWSLPIVPFISPDITLTGELKRNASSAVNVVANNTLAHYPLSLAQQRFLIAEKMSGKALYNLCSILHFNKGLNIDTLQQSIKCLVSRHKILQTTYRELEAGLWQPVLLDDINEQKNLFNINVRTSNVTCDNKNRSELESWCQSEYENQLAKPFDLTKELPFRVDLFSHTKKPVSDNNSEGFYLFFTIHHVAFDAWSAQQLIKELVIIYSALHKEPTIDIATVLPELAIQYQDYAAWQRAWLQGHAYKKQQQYWQQHLNDYPEPLKLPIDFCQQEKHKRSHAGEMGIYHLSESLSQQIKTQVKAQGTTLYSYLQTAFSWLLATYTGQQDFCLGTSVANRDKAELNDLIGPLLNTLVIRHRLDTTLSFTQALEKTQNTVSAAFDNKDYPFEHLSKVLPKEHQSPLFNVMFVHVALPTEGKLALPETDIEVVSATQKHARFDVTLRVTESIQGISLELEYATELFSEKSIQQWLSHFNQLLEQVSSQPELTLELISFSDAMSTLAGEDLVNSPILLLEKIQHWGKQTPDGIALRELKENTLVALTYSELNQRIDALAVYLQQQGLTKGELVAICMHRSREQLVVQLACWRLGLITVLLDPRQSPMQHQKVLENAKPQIVFVANHTDEQKIVGHFPLENAENNAAIKTINASFIFLQTLPTSTSESISKLPVLTSTDPAYIIYTSGSTGTPKGVVIHHGAISHYSAAITQRLAKTYGVINKNINNVDNKQAKQPQWLTLATVAADLGLTSVFAALYLGESILLLDAELAFNPPALAEFLTQHPVDYLKIVPSHLKGLLSTDKPQTLLPQRALLLGGEGLDKNLYQQITELKPELAIINHYGPSEATVGISSKLLFSWPDNTVSTVAPLGHLLPGTSIQVRGSQGRSVPKGVSGELYIAGPQVSQGYWQLTQQTQQAFLQEGDKRYYRSGDLVRINRDNELEYLGRLDDQIKRRGYRLELGEINAWLTMLDGISLSSSLIYKDNIDNNKQQLLTFIEVNNAQKEQTQNHKDQHHKELLQTIRNTLPNYMVADEFIIVDKILLNDNGKVNRQKLLSDFISHKNSALESSSIGLMASNVGDQKAATKSINPVIKKQLRDIWLELLNIDKPENLSLEDDFFALGGDSILSLQLIAMARRHNLVLKPTDVIAYSQFGAMAKLLSADINDKNDAQAKAIENTLITLFTEVLANATDTSAITKDSDFFQCGGDSILSLQLIAKAHKADIALTPKLLMRSATPCGLAQLLLALVNTTEANTASSNSKQQITIPRLNNKARYQPHTLSASQQRIWFLQQFDPNSTTYNVSQVFALRGHINIAALEQAVQQLLAKHDILRCRYFEKDAQVFQQLLTLNELTTPLTLHKLSEGAHEKQWHKEIDSAINRVFDLASGNVFAIDLFECSSNQYQLVINLHHIVTDGWSMGVLVQDFIALYTLFTTKSTSDAKAQLEGLEKQAGYLDWLANLVSKQAAEGNSKAQSEESLEHYWLKRLEGASHTISLPVDKPYPAVQSSKGKLITTKFSDSLTKNINTLASAHQTTPFNVLLAAFKILLWRHSGERNETEFTVGIPVSGREEIETQNIVGVFINTIASRHHLDSRLGFSDWLKRIQKDNLEDFTHQALPVENLFDLLGVERQLARPSLFQTLFNYQSDVNNTRELTLPDITLAPINKREVSAKYELSFNLFKQEGLSLQVEFNSDLFSDATIERLIGDYKDLLAQICHQPEAALDHYQLPSMVQVHCAGEQKDIAVSDDFIARFEHSVKQYPEKTALVANDKTLSYAQLNSEANQLAYWLIEQGLRPEDLVAFCLPRDSRLLITLLAIQKAGAAYLPLDPSHPAERLRYIAEHAKVSLCLCDAHLMPQLAPVFAGLCVQDACGVDQSIQLINIDDVIKDQKIACEKTPALSTQNPAVTINKQNLAYVLYTSGSTGKPKGVQLERTQFANFLCAIEQVLPEFSAILALTTITFDIAGLELCLPLVKGASVVLADDAARLDTATLDVLIEENDVDLIQATPAGWQLLRDISAKHLSNITALAGGEALDNQLAAFLQSSCKGLINVYGPTETTVWSSSYTLKGIDTPELQAGVVPIGQPLLNNQCIVLDEALQPVPIGVVGELYIGGHGLARGYQFRPDLTAERFIPNPQSNKGERLYRTGDKVKWLANGELTFIGRTDNQIKLRGLRIELGEIEASLLLHNDIAQAAVLVKSEQLIAYIVVEASKTSDYVTEESTLNSTFNSTLNSNLFNTYLSTLLPDYMLPQRYQLLEAMPLNSNGKIDRNTLDKQPLAEPLQTGTKRELQGKVQREFTVLENTIANIWKTLLNQQAVYLNDNFFELGGHSLLAVQVRARLAEQGFSLPLKAFFENPTLAMLAQELNRADKNTDEVAITVVAREEFMPLSSAQQRLWFMQSMSPNDTSFNMSSVLDLAGHLDYSLMQTAIDSVVAKHEILRTTYHDINGQGFQKIHEYLTISISFVDFTNNNLTHSIDEQIAKAANSQFDLAKEAPIKVYVYKVGKGAHVCQLVQHHIASDGWSTIILMNDLTTAYEQAKKQAASPLALLNPLPIQYVDYALWQNTQLKSQQKDIEYWRGTLAGMPPQLTFPFIKTNTLEANDYSNDYRGDAVDFTLPGELTAKLKQLARDNQSSLFMVLMAALSAQLHHHTQSEDIVIGTDVANRQQAQTEGLIGFFVNLIAIRNRPKSSQTFSDYLQQTRRVCIDSLDHQQLPFDKVVEAVKPKRISGIHPIIQALLVVQNMPVTHTHMDDIKVTQRQNLQKHSKFNMALFVHESVVNELESAEQKTSLSIRWLFRRALFERSAIEFLAKDLLRLLHAITDKPSTSLAGLSAKEKGNTTMNTVSANHELKTSGKRKLSKLGKMKKLKKGGATKKPQALINTRTLVAGKPFPLLVESREPGLDAFAWAEKNQEQIIQWLETHGGILFRGFNLPTPVDFEKFCQAMYPELYGQYGDLPKRGLGKKIYKSTPYPNNQMIMYHNESSHQYRWPRRQWFYCEIPAQSGGATPIVDCREMYLKLPEDIRDKLEQKKLCYTRNFSDLDVSWQHFFKTEDRSEVEKICREGNITFEWYGEDNLKISEICPAVIKHPVTGVMSFFNQIQLHHYSFLEASVREHLLRAGGEEQLPRNVYYGDGEPLEQSVIDLISELYEECAVRFDWQHGDVVMVDNMLAAHARDPFEGKRQMAVAMGDMYYRESVELASKKNNDKKIENNGLENKELHGKEPAGKKATGELA